MEKGNGTNCAFKVVVVQERDEISSSFQEPGKGLEPVAKRAAVSCRLTGSNCEVRDILMEFLEMLPWTPSLALLPLHLEMHSISPLPDQCLF